MSTARKGATLVEVMVTSCLLLIVLLGVQRLVAFGLRYWQVAREGEQTHQEALVALGRMESELCETRRDLVQSSVGALPAPYPYVMFPSPGSPFTYDDGELEWHKWIAFYLRDRDLVQAEVAFTPATEPPAARPPLRAFVDSGTERVVARSVESFSVADGTYPPLLRVAVTTRRATASDKATELTLTSQVRPGN